MEALTVFPLILLWSLPSLLHSPGRSLGWRTLKQTRLGLAETCGLSGPAAGVTLRSCNRQGTSRQCFPICRRNGCRGPSPVSSLHVLHKPSLWASQKTPTAEAICYGSHCHHRIKCHEQKSVPTGGTLGKTVTATVNIATIYCLTTWCWAQLKALCA